MVPDAVTASLWTALAPYHRAFPEARWLDPTTWHLTLVFVGSTPISAAASLARACDDVAARWPVFDLDVAGGGGHVRRGEGVAWLTVVRNAGQVIGIADDLVSVVRRDVRGIPEPRRARSAHLTVARRAGVPLVASLGSEAHGPIRDAWHAERLCLIRSHLGRESARHETVHTALLGGGHRPGPGIS